MSSKTSYSASGHALWSKMPKANAELFALTYGSLVTELIRDYDSHTEVNAQLERIGHSMGVRCVDELLAKSEIYNLPLCGPSKGGGNNNLRETAEVICKVGFRMFLGVSNCEVANFDSAGTSFSILLHENPLAVFVELPPPNPSSNIHNASSSSSSSSNNTKKLNQTMNNMSINNSNNNETTPHNGEMADKSSDPNTASAAAPLPEDNIDIQAAGTTAQQGCDLSKLRYSNIYCGVIKGALEQVNLRVDCYFVKDTLHGDDTNEIRVELKEVLVDGAGDDYKEE